MSPDVNGWPVYIIDLKHSAPSSFTRNADILQRPIIFAGVRGKDDKCCKMLSLYLHVSRLDCWKLDNLLNGGL